MPGTGDPGIFGAIKGAVGGFLRGGPVGALTGAVSGFTSGGRPRSPVPARLPSFPTGVGPRFAPPVQSRNGGGTITSPAGTTIKCPSGTHPNKSDYFLKDGSFIPKGSRCVKNRRRNPLNPDALRRAVGRIDAGKVWQEKMREIETSKFTKAGKRKAC